MSNGELAFLNEVTGTLAVTQRELAEVIGCSLRTVQRIYRGRSGLSHEQHARLVRAVHPKNHELAARIASHASMTLDQCGIAPPPRPPVAAPVVVPAPAPPPPLSPHAADSILCAAADLMKLPPRSVRPIVMAVFVRARDLGLTVETVTAALLASEHLEPEGEAPKAPSAGA